jgi:hypothetical protein
VRVTIVAIALASVLLAAGHDDDGGVGGVDIVTGNSGTEIIIDGSQATPGDPGTSPIGDWDSDTDADWTPPSDWTPPPEFDFQTCLDNWDSYIHCFRASDETEEEEVAEEGSTPAIPAITIADVARFAPAGSAIAGEPDNVGVVGLPTNFVATASVHTVNDSLFGFPVAVRFTPAGYDYRFGDGTTATTTTGGRSWADLGQAQFTPTATSHTYVERGTYSAQVDLRYTAEVDFGIGWFPISGEVTSVGTPQQIRIFEAHTALVARTCEQAPDSPGC